MRIHAIAACGVCLTLAACVHENARTTTGASSVLPLFEQRGPGGAAPALDDVPSVTGLSRQAWAPISVALEPDRVQSRPTYAPVRAPDTDSARGRGDPVTARSALEQGTTQTWSQYGEAFASPLYALGDLFMMPYRMYQNPPWSGTQDQPGGVYWRAPVGTDRGKVASKAAKETSP